jgi:phage gp29-like protein
MSSDAQASGLGSANALVHNEVRGDLRDADSTQLAATYQRHLVKPYIDLNHGPQAHYPKVIIRRRKPEDVQQLANALAQLVPLGLEVEQSVVRDKLSLPDPEKGALLLRPASPAGPALNLALNRAGAVAPDASTRLADRMADEAASPHAALIEHLRREVAAASSLEDLRDRLLNAYADLPGDKLAQVMQAGFAVAELVGRYDVGASDG